MKNDPLEDKAMEAYRSFLAGEVSRPEVKNDKRLFMSSKFPMQPIWVRGAGVLVPAMAVFCLFFLFHMGILSVPQLNVGSKAAAPAVKITPADAPLVTAEAPTRIEVAMPKKLKKIKIMVPTVLVKRATSDMGQPMVHQGKVNDKPVTVIWVFTGSKVGS